jgi:uncharacterized protein YndB with AHSA1/START domain
MRHCSSAPVSMSTLIVRRTIRATAERLFDVWTRPDDLQRWWGPQGVTCIAAAVDLRVGGRYRIGNQFPSGEVVWITGEFEAIERPHRLAYTWRLESQPGPPERVTVMFVAAGATTEVVITHERIANAVTRARHEQGWCGCLEGLARYLDTTDS